MNKFEKTLIALAVAGTVGFAFAFAALKGIPEVFEWELDEEESYE
jgi:hypothetical protein